MNLPIGEDLSPHLDGADQAGATGGTLVRVVDCRSSRTSPAASNTARVFWSHRHPPANHGQTGLTKRCTRRIHVPPSAATCSRTAIVPSGRRTRRASAITRAGFSTLQSTYANNTESTLSSGSGKSSPTASITSTGIAACSIAACARVAWMHWARPDDLGDRVGQMVQVLGRPEADDQQPSVQMRRDLGASSADHAGVLRFGDESVDLGEQGGHVATCTQRKSADGRRGPSRTDTVHDNGGPQPMCWPQPVEPDFPASTRTHSPRTVEMCDS